MTRGARVAALRGEVEESVHRVAALALDRGGRPLAAWGRVRREVVLRSTAKPFQAAAVLASGALDAAALADDELALLAASHSGEERHTRLAARLLDRLGLPAAALRCGRHPPFHAETARRLGDGHGPLHHNCSGKHVALLALARHRGVPLVSYLDPASPGQREVLEAIALAAGVAPESLRTATDGCGAPTFVLPLAAAARAFGRLARPAGLRAPLAAALERVAAAMAAHPEIVAGTDRFDTALGRATGGRLVAKSGAEGVEGVADRASGQALFVKVEDGAGRAVPPATVESLRRLGALGAPELAALAVWQRPVLTTFAGEATARLVPYLSSRARSARFVSRPPP